MLPSRPKPTDPHIRQAAVIANEPALREWAASSDLDADDVEILQYTILAVSQLPDAFKAARYLEDFAKIPADMGLVRILDRMYASLPAYVTEATRDWVMRSEVRFKPKTGDTVTVRIGGTKVLASVVAVLETEARGFVTLNGDEKKRPIPVLAEDVIDILPKGKTVPNTTPPVGGTPAAVTLKQAAA